MHARESSVTAATRLHNTRARAALLCSSGCAPTLGGWPASSRRSSTRQVEGVVEGRREEAWRGRIDRLGVTRTTTLRAMTVMAVMAVMTIMTVMTVMTAIQDCPLIELGVDSLAIAELSTLLQDDYA